MADWMMVVLSAISVVGAGVSWLRSNVSKKAREEAAKAEERAATHEEAMRSQAESLGSLAESMQGFVADARARAEEARGRAEQASGSAESARLSAESLADMRSQLERIAESVEPRREVSVREVSKNRFAIKNNRPTHLSCEHVRNRSDFARLDLKDKFTIVPGAQLHFWAHEAYGYPVPDNLVIDEVGLDAPTVIPIERLA